MTTPQAANPAAMFATMVGRYFTIVSLVPSLLLVAFITVLVESGAWDHEPEFSKGFLALTQLGLGGTFAIVLGALALGVILHPLQFALVQFLEGYWGVSPFWSSLRDDRIHYHLRRRHKLNVHRHKAVGLPNKWKEVVQTAARLEARRLKSIYPVDPVDVMPTRLGNVLRAAERSIGASVGLDIIDFAPHLMAVAPREHVNYVNDQRTSLDLAIRSCLVCLLGFVGAVLYLWPHKLWFLVALVPLGLAWLCYRGAVTAAQEYGEALRTLFDLNRFALYERMGFSTPVTSAAEREIISALIAFSSEPKTIRIRADEEPVIRYRHTRSATPE